MYQSKKLLKLIMNDDACNYVGLSDDANDDANNYIGANNDAGYYIGVNNDARNM